MSMERASGEGHIFNIQKFCLHDGPGIRTAVFFKGCPLRCKWCSNPEAFTTDITAGGDEKTDAALTGKIYTVDEVVKICLADKVFYEESGGGVTITGGEALTQPEFTIALLQRLKDEGIHRAIETSGHAPEETFISIIGETDLVLFDIKHYDNCKHREGTGEDNSLILQNLKRAIDSGAKLLIRIPVIPQYNDSIQDAQGFAELIKQYGLKEAQLLPFHQFGQSKYDKLGIPYALENLKTLYPEDLQAYQQTMAKAGIEAFF